MDASGDTMLNGNGINSGPFTSSYCGNTSGVPISHSTIFLPMPNDTNKFILLHQAPDPNTPYYSPGKVSYTVLDMTLNNNLGAVLNGQKNLIALQDTFIGGIAACRHANGRDWWIIAPKDSSSGVFKILLSSNGTITSSYQQLNFPVPYGGNAGQPCFSPDGTKFAYTCGRIIPQFQDVRVFSFNRCTGVFDSIGYVAKSGQSGFGLSFSPDSRYLYYSSFGQIFQLDTDAPDIAASDTLVATYDGYCHPYSFSCTNFWLMYKAANGKIYITSSNYVIDLHVINSPDSAGLACDLQQHALRLPCYAAYGNVNHPNYYLGCDTTLGCPCLVTTSLNENGKHDFSIKLSPNPGSSGFEILYLLPQNKNGILSVYDLQGRLMHKQLLPQWSTMQHIPTSNWAGGVYQVRIESEGYFNTSKWVKY